VANNRNRLGVFLKEIREMYLPHDGESLPYIGLEHIIPDALALNGVGDSASTVSTKKIFKHGDILFGTLRPYFRKVIKAKFNGVCSTDIAVLRAFADDDTDYFLYFIADTRFIEFASNQSNGTRMPRTNWKILAKSKWDIPDAKTRKAIGIILSAYDDLIENNTRRIKILEEMAQRIYREWFVHFRYPGHENHSLVESELGMIPEGWEIHTTEDVMSVTGGGTPSTTNTDYWENGDINWYTPSDLTKSNVMFSLESEHRITEEGLKKSSAKLFPAFSVMLTSRATIGIVAINTTQACTNQGFITCIPSDSFSTYQIYFWMLENVEMFKTLATGSTFKELIKSVFKKFLIAVPHPQIAMIFNETINPLALEILSLQKKQVLLKRTRDLLLPKLISGQIDVSDLDIDTEEVA